jgi:hypothetical protein
MGDCVLDEPQVKRLHTLMAAARRGGTFLLLVGVVTIGSVGVYRARAMLDEQAEFYVARRVDAPFEALREAQRQAPQPSAVANLAVEVRPDPKPAQPALATIPAQPATTDAAATTPDLHEAIGQADDPAVTGAIAGKGGAARFSTVYIHRGAEPPAAYIVPRE